MYNFQEFLTERYVNLFQKDIEQRELYVDDVWNMLQQSYKKIGGIKGSGFNSKEDMIKKLPFWKLVRKDGKIVAGSMYKDRGGRKRVASFTDGTDAGKTGLAGIMIEDFSRAYFEVSKGSLGMIIKNLGYEFITKHAKSIDQVKTILPNDEILPVPNDDEHVRRNPKLKHLFYQRELGGKPETKIMLGTTGNKLVISEE